MVFGSFDGENADELNSAGSVIISEIFATQNAFFFEIIPFEEYKQNIHQQYLVHRFLLPYCCLQSTQGNFIIFDIWQVRLLVVEICIEICICTLRGFFSTTNNDGTIL